jgi:hypothetical protein
MLDYHSAAIQAVLVNINKDPKAKAVKPADFMTMKPEPPKPKQRDPLEVIRRLDAYNIAAKHGVSR